MSNKSMKVYGKVAKFPKNSKASKCYNFLENIKIPKNKLWYFIIEKDDECTKNSEELQVIKYNNKQGVNCSEFMENLTEYYKNDNTVSKYISNFEIIGNNDFSIIKNIPNIEIEGKKLISKLTEDLIKLLYTD